MIELINNAEESTMAGKAGAPVRQRRVATELRAMRVKAGLTCAQVAQAIGVSTTKISRMETGDRGMYVEDVATLLGLYRVPAKRRAELLDLVREGATRNWHQAPKGTLPQSWEDVIRFEADAAALANFEPLVIPGLFQTPEYMRAMTLGITDEITEAELDLLVRTRMSRQAILAKRSAPDLNVIIYEVALRCPVGEPGVMRRQLRHLLACADRPNVNLRVLPFATGAHPGLEGPFVIIDFPDQPSLVYLEHRGNTTFLEEEKHLKATRMAWRRLSAKAMAKDDSLRLVASIAEDMP
ncbi:MAG TPA: helix-turn-helix transcriptional regulator [Pseudonocardiaceae bacterium]|nr:helix-turn-helix transcriptional regulator [Pseudonocardiaceae bacterium]